MATYGYARTSLFQEVGTNDVLAILELSNIPASSGDIIDFSFTPAGDAIFGLNGLEGSNPFFGTGLVSTFGPPFLHSVGSQATWVQDIFLVAGPDEFLTYHLAMEFNQFLTSRLELTGDATATANGNWLLLPETFDDGDYNHDGDINGLDYSVWQSFFGSTTNLDADGNDNGVVDAADYTVWRDNSGSSSQSATTSVPEPSSVMLIALVGMLLPRRLY